MGRLPNLLVERDRRKSREGFAQHALASFMVGGPIARQNTPHSLCEQGRRLIERLDTELFGRPHPGTSELFVEFKLSGRDEGEGNGYPDLALLWSNRLLVTELKTEPGSVREGQVDQYAELAVHHHPELQVDVLYLTRDEVDSPPPVGGVGYANVTWERLGPWIQDAWHDATDEDHLAAALFTDYIDQVLRAGRFLPPPSPTPDRSTVATTDDAQLAEALDAAQRAVEIDDQTSYEYPWGSPEEAKGFRRALIEALSPELPVDPWVWRSSTGGAALTPTGAATGIELRLSPRRAGR